MPQIVLYEWNIIFSGSLLHTTPTPCLHIAYCENCHCISLIALILLVLHSPGLEPLAHGGGGLVAALPRLELLPAAAAAPQQPRHPCSVQSGHIQSTSLME